MYITLGKTQMSDMVLQLSLRIYTIDLVGFSHIHECVAVSEEIVVGANES